MILDAQNFHTFSQCCHTPGLQLTTYLLVLALDAIFLFAYVKLVDDAVVFVVLLFHPSLAMLLLRRPTLYSFL